MRIWPSGGEGAAALLDDRKWAYLRMGTVEHLILQMVKAGSCDDSDQTTSLHGRQIASHEVK